jgi:hypothetical protein
MTNSARLIRGFLTVMFCVWALVALNADGNVCCGTLPGEGNCSSEGCGDDDICMAVVLGEATSCCGLGGGNVSCNSNPGQGSGFCVDCYSGSHHCGYCSDPLE